MVDISTMSPESTPWFIENETILQKDLFEKYQGPDYSNFLILM